MKAEENIKYYGSKDEIFYILKGDTITFIKEYLPSKNKFECQAHYKIFVHNKTNRQFHLYKDEFNKVK